MDEWPNATDRAQCVPIIPTWLRFGDPLGTGLATISGIGIMLCIGVFVLFTVNTEHELIKASSRELMYLILIGIIVCYTFVLSFPFKPTEAKCIVKFIGISLSFTLIYSPMTCKVIRIYRLFRIGRYVDQRPHCVGYKSQLLLSTAIVLLDVSILHHLIIS